MIKHWYAVRKGRKPNVVVKSWVECEALVKGFPGAIYKGFSLWQKDQAEQFAKSGHYGKHTPKEKKDVHSTPHWPCLERKSYKDPFTGVYFKNRCIRRQGPTVTGINYKPHIGNSIPWGQCEDV